MRKFEGRVRSAALAGAGDSARAHLARQARYAPPQEIGPFSRLTVALSEATAWRQASTGARRSETRRYSRKHHCQTAAAPQGSWLLISAIARRGRWRWANSVAGWVRPLMAEIAPAAQHFGQAISLTFIQAQIDVTPGHGAYQRSSLGDYLAGRSAEGRRTKRAGGGTLRWKLFQAWASSWRSVVLAVWARSVPCFCRSKASSMPLALASS